MWWLFILSFFATASSVCDSTLKLRHFPDDFLFGASTSAYQIEGGWNIDGKSESIWDHFTHTHPNAIVDGSNGDIAADSYNNYKRDVEMMRELGLDVYRFSLSWSRILPNGFSNKINPAGIEFYNNYINEMLKYGITPMVTLYHWDLPQKLQGLGGFANPLIADWFEDYARVAYEHFGDRVKDWITFNEPHEFCYFGYGSSYMAPMLNSTDVGTYLCAKHLLLAHAKAYHAYNNDFKKTQGGKCGITFSVGWFQPATNSPEDIFASEIRSQGHLGIYTDPIFSAEGGFPKEFSERVAEKSTAQGYKRSRLPIFSKEEKKFIKGSADFFGVNHYEAWFVSATEYKRKYAVPSLDDDTYSGTYKPKEWPTSAASWISLAPHSLYNVIIDLHKKYSNTTFYVTENGWASTPDSGLIDDDRIAYYRAALEDVLDCLDEGVKVKGYMAWSLMDNFEWAQGYTKRFGLYHVDFSSPSRTRTARKSALVYKHIVSHRYIDHTYSPQNLTMTIDEGH